MANSKRMAIAREETEPTATDHSMARTMVSDQDATTNGRVRDFLPSENLGMHSRRIRKYYRLYRTATIRYPAHGDFDRMQMMPAGTCISYSSRRRCPIPRHRYRRKRRRRTISHIRHGGGVPPRNVTIERGCRPEHASHNIVDGGDIPHR